MVKAGSLFYALILLLLIGVLLSVLLLTTGTDKLIRSKLTLENEHIDFTTSSIAYGLANYNELSKETKTIDPFNNGFKANLKKQKWGFLDLLYCQTYIRKDTLTRNAFIGNTTTNDLALYLSDRDKPLYLYNTTIKGNYKIPARGISTLNIKSNTSNRNTISGQKSTSKNQLPEIVKPFTIDYNNFDKLTTDDISTQEKNVFSNKAKIIYMKGVNLANSSLSGKYIIRSFDSICIKRTAKLQNVIIQSPKVFIEEGFRGSIQVFATEQITLAKNVTLENPSVLYLNNDVKKDVSIEIAEGSTLQGAIILQGNSGNRTNNYLSLGKNVQVAGTIYCNGVMEHKAKAYGTVYADSFELDTGDAKYNNALKDATIDVKALPDNFVSVNMLANRDEIIEVLQWLE